MVPSNTGQQRVRLLLVLLALAVWSFGVVLLLQSAPKLVLHDQEKRRVEGGANIVVRSNTSIISQREPYRFDSQGGARSDGTSSGSSSNNNNGQNSSHAVAESSSNMQGASSESSRNDQNSFKAVEESSNVQDNASLESGSNSNSNKSNNTRVGPYYSFNAAESYVMQLLDDYKRHHCADVLQREYEASPGNPAFMYRRYVKGMYACPHRAGNQLYTFLNAFLYAVVTNRTLLWDYCTIFRLCPNHGSVSDCNKVLHRADWIPSFLPGNNAWAGQLDKVTRVFNQTVVAIIEEIVQPRGQMMDELEHQVLDFGVMLTPGHGEVLTTPAAAQVLSNHSHQVAQRLFSAGTSFVYGALFNTAFSLNPALVKAAMATQPGQVMLMMGQQQQSQAFNSGEGRMISMAIHSRHRHNLDKGENSTLDEICLEQAYRAVQQVTTSSSASNTTASCSVVIMSDRNATLRKLTTKVETLGCQAVMATHVMPGRPSLKREHGPLAGVGFFEDLALAQYATGAVIKTSYSTASEIMAALATFHRAATRQKDDHAPLVFCAMRHQIGNCTCGTKDVAALEA